MKEFLRKMISSTAMWVARTSAGSYAYEQVVNAAMSRQRTVTHGAHRMTFAVPNWLNRYRIDTFATKEPDTLEWIDSIPEGSVVWDIGANIGLYAIYAAKARNCEVYAYEPSVFNLELLARNIFLNNLQHLITIVPLSLSAERGVSSFKTTTTTWGGALSTFGEGFDQDGNPLKPLFEYRTVGVAMSDVTGFLDIPRPQYIKIDVDGLEHFILRGGADVLARTEGVMIEVNDAFDAQREETARHLAAAGLVLTRKCDLGLESMFNQWWTRDARPADQGPA